jgi:hypothetical protein
MLLARSQWVFLSFKTFPRMGDTGLKASLETDTFVAQGFLEAVLGMSRPLGGVKGQTLQWACSAGFGPMVKWAPTGRCRRV